MLARCGDLEALVKPKGMLVLAQQRRVCGEFRCADPVAALAPACTFGTTHGPACKIRKTARPT